jgi:CRP-like cAMP-binding protein
MLSRASATLRIGATPAAWRSPKLAAMSTLPRSADLKITGLISSLRCCQLFTGLPSEDLAAIASFSLQRVVAKDDYLFRQGAVSEGFYVMVRGAINVHRVSAEGKEQVIHVFRTGETFAEAALASPTGYPADARAVEPSTVLVIPKAPILAFLGRRPDLAMRMLGSMSAHLRVLVGMLDDLTLKDVETRLVNWLVKHSGGRAGIVALPGTKRVLAAELGTSSETLSRTLAKLRDQELISVAGQSPSRCATPGPSKRSCGTISGNGERAGGVAFAPAASARPPPTGHPQGSLLEGAAPSAPVARRGYCPLEVGSPTPRGLAPR